MTRGRKTTVAYAGAVKTFVSTYAKFFALTKPARPYRRRSRNV